MLINILEDGNNVGMHLQCFIFLVSKPLLFSVLRCAVSAERTSSVIFPSSRSYETLAGLSRPAFPSVAKALPKQREEMNSCGGVKSSGFLLTSTLCNTIVVLI